MWFNRVFSREGGRLKSPNIPGGATNFEVAADARHECTISGAVVATGKMTASNGTWNIKAVSRRVEV